jgi:hypothetical protein
MTHLKITHLKSVIEMCNYSVLCAFKSSTREPVERIWVQIKYIKTVDFVRVQYPWRGTFLDDTHKMRELDQTNAIWSYAVGRCGGGSLVSASVLLHGLQLQPKLLRLDFLLFRHRIQNDSLNQTVQGIRRIN